MLLKNWRLLAALAASIVILAAVLVSHKDSSSSSKCGPYRSDKVLKVGTQQINAEVASTPQQQAKGLGGRPCIEANQAMLFLFNKPNYYAFWMKDMHFPIDIVWISSDHKTVGLERSVEPSTYPDHFTNKDKPAQYVLEIQANRSKTLGIDLGTAVNF
jgi:uncharacterized protein